MFKPKANQLERKPRSKGHLVAVRVTAENPDAGFNSSDSLQELKFRSSTNVCGYFSIFYTSSQTLSFAMFFLTVKIATKDLFNRTGGRPIAAQESKSPETDQIFGGPSLTLRLRLTISAQRDCPTLTEHATGHEDLHAIDSLGGRHCSIRQTTWYRSGSRRNRWNPQPR